MNVLVTYTIIYGPDQGWKVDRVVTPDDLPALIKDHGNTIHIHKLELTSDPARGSRVV